MTPCPCPMRPPWCPAETSLHSGGLSLSAPNLLLCVIDSVFISGRAQTARLSHTLVYPLGFPTKLTGLGRDLGAVVFALFLSILR